jgi:hypothetical protein
MAVLGGEAPDARAICLADDDAIAIVLREDVSAGPRPARDLRLVALCRQLYEYAT